MKRWLLIIATAASMLSLTGCGYNDFQRLDEKSKAAWGEVLNQYQRRSDLIPNIVATVKGEASFEQDTLTKVIEARAKATSIQATPELINNPEAFNKFQQAQGELQRLQGRLAALEALQQAALDPGKGTAEWLREQQLSNRPPLAAGLRVEAGWELAVETVLGADLQAVLLDDFQGLDFAGLTQGDLRLEWSEK